MDWEKGKPVKFINLMKEEWKRSASLRISVSYGATIGAWTRDLILTMDALYQLSYRGVTGLILAY